MQIDAVALTNFRKQLRDVVESSRDAWRASRRLVSPELAPETIKRLRAALAASSLDPSVRDSLLLTLLPGEAMGLKGVSGEALRKLTGQNPTKAIRNLCLFLGVKSAEGSAPVSGLSPQEIEAALRASNNPFDLLVSADVASLVDFGAGDLTFEEQLVERYLPAVERTGKDLIIHCLDRLSPEEEAGNLVRVGRERLQRLEHPASSWLRFRFFGNQDMFTLSSLGAAWPRYTIAVCYSPASPTFAYEPARVSEGLIQQRLRETKGEFRRGKRGGRQVLEVRHGEEWLTFPAWKFNIYGPLALLDLLSRSGRLCVMGAVDMEVFWEILAQLLPDDRARPRDVFFTPENVREYFGPVYERLSALAVGEGTVLSDVRRDIPRVLAGEREQGQAYTFQYVEIRRGAVFPGVPAGKTAYVFEQMTREAAPWFLTLVPSV